MKRFLVAMLVFFLFLGACTPNPEKKRIITGKLLLISDPVQLADITFDLKVVALIWDYKVLDFQKILNVNRCYAYPVEKFSSIPSGKILAKKVRIEYRVVGLTNTSTPLIQVLKLEVLPDLP